MSGKLTAEEAEKIDEVLQRFGKQSFRAGQKQIIACAVRGQSVLGVLPTGYGKSFCYQAAAYLRGGTSVVISPLLALMREQVEYLHNLGIRAARFDSTLGQTERAEVLNCMMAGDLQLLYTAPESLRNSALNDAMHRITPELFIVDEAHCISQWGHSFRPDYLRLPTWAANFPFAATMAFTATATHEVKTDLCRVFNISQKNIIEISPYRPNIERIVISTTNKWEHLLTHIRQPSHRPCIVYTDTRKDAEEFAARLSDAGYPATYYHAGMPSDLRNQLQDNFLVNKPDILVATVAFGMGVDKADVRSVVHVCMPTSPEAYIQESGRAGRDGLPSTSLVLMNDEDRINAYKRVDTSVPNVESVLRCVRWLLPDKARVVSLWELRTSCGVPDDVPQRILDILLEYNAIHIESKGYKFYRVRPLLSMASILRGRHAQEQARLRWLNDHREGEVEEAARAWACSFAEAMTQLSECELADEWELHFRRRALCICPENGHTDARDIAGILCDMYTKRREVDLMRLTAITQMLTDPANLNKALEEYFRLRRRRVHF